MSKLNPAQKQELEKLFHMRDGGVMDFTNKEFQLLVWNAVEIDIKDEKYNSGPSGSKANRLRAFWKEEPDLKVAILLEKLLEYWRSKSQTGEIKYEPSDEARYEACLKIVDALQPGNRVEDVSVLAPNSTNVVLLDLSRSIKAAILAGKPEFALDRLHTYMLEYMRELCDKHGIDYNKNTALHSLMGSYIKALDKNGVIESEMTRRILKTSISLFEAFNPVRNEQSLAHPNPVLNQNESIFIINGIINSVGFLESLEKGYKQLG